MLFWGRYIAFVLSFRHKRLYAQLLIHSHGYSSKLSRGMLACYQWIFTHCYDTLIGLFLKDLLFPFFLYKINHQKVCMRNSILKENETNWWFGVIQNLEPIKKLKYDFFNEHFTRAGVKARLYLIDFKYPAKPSSLAKGYNPLYSSSPLASLDGFSRSHGDGLYVMQLVVAATNQNALYKKHMFCRKNVNKIKKRVYIK